MDFWDWWENWQLRRRIVGWLAVAVGALWLAHALGWTDWSVGVVLARWWPLVLVAWALSHLARPRRPGRWLRRPLVVLLLGLALLAANNHLVAAGPGADWAIVGAGLLLYAGLGLVWGHESCFWEWWPDDRR